jgi:hypothetical protein
MPGSTPTSLQARGRRIQESTWIRCLCSSILHCRLSPLRLRRRMPLLLSMLRPSLLRRLPHPQAVHRPPSPNPPFHTLPKYRSHSSSSPDIAKPNPLSQKPQSDGSRSSYGTHGQRVMQVRRHFRPHCGMIGRVVLISRFDRDRPASLRSSSVLVWLRLAGRTPTCAILSPNTVSGKDIAGRRYATTCVFGLFSFLFLACYSLVSVVDRRCFGFSNANTPSSMPMILSCSARTIC